jgi:ERCC4-related helicase
LSTQPKVVPQVGQFVRVRGRNWLVESGLTPADALRNDHDAPPIVTVSCVDDDASGTTLDLLWPAELDTEVLKEGDWASLASGGIESISTFAAYLKTVKWNTATATDPSLFQAPFRAGIKLDAYQLEPLRKALALPRVNLLIADDVGLGKTVEAGLIVRELLLRRRIDFVVVAAPPSMTLQWQEELETKFGLTFSIIDRENLAALRRERGYIVNPWATGSKFIVSHKLLIDPTYTSGLYDLLGEFRPRSLLILDEAHHAAPASGAKYAIDSRFTKAIRELASRFEHRLFLTATPHNGHSNSFSALLEMLDPQRFTRGVPVRPAQLDAVMVRRLKEDLRSFGYAFPERIVEPIRLQSLSPTAPELALSSMMEDYRQLRERRIALLPPGQQARARLAFVGLQQRLLSSVYAFGRTLTVHSKGLDRAIESGAATSAASSAAARFVEMEEDEVLLEGEDSEARADALVELDDEAALAATLAGAEQATVDQLRAERALVAEMQKIADAARTHSDARVDWLVHWIDENMRPGGTWNSRRLIVFTEYEDTRRWLERRLRTIIDDDERIAVFTGATATEKREEVKRRFTTSPEHDTLRILICTDAAREGINLQAYCHDLVHLDLPWNPARLEQRNGRIDRKLQPSPKVSCRYFLYEQRPEDVVLQKLVEKTETIREQLGSAGRVLGSRIADQLSRDGISRSGAVDLAATIDADQEDERVAKAVEEMDDEQTARRQRLAKDQERLRDALEKSRRSVGVEPTELEHVVDEALKLARGGSRFGLPAAIDEGLRDHVFELDVQDPLFAADPSWLDALDTLRTRRRRKGESVASWRHDETAKLRPISFSPPETPDGEYAGGEVVQLHLEHRLVRRLLARFQTIGFSERLARACVVETTGDKPRVVLLAKLALYGPRATRLHEEILTVTAQCKEPAARSGPLKPYGQAGESTTLAELEKALASGHRVPDRIVEHVTQTLNEDVADLAPDLDRRAAEAKEQASAALVHRGEAEARALRKLLDDQRDRLLRAAREHDQTPGLFAKMLPEETRQREKDRKMWDERLAKITAELDTEPARVIESYAVGAFRLEPIGLVYLWPHAG